MALLLVLLILVAPTYVKELAHTQNAIASRPIDDDDFCDGDRFFS